MGDRCGSIHARGWIAEGGNRPTPVFPIGIGAAADTSHIGAMAAQALTTLAGNDAAVESVERGGRNHSGILWHRWRTVEVGARFKIGIAANRRRSESIEKLGKLCGQFFVFGLAKRDTGGGSRTIF
jgi:hypothetical protein